MDKMTASKQTFLVILSIGVALSQAGPLTINVVKPQPKAENEDYRLTKNKVIPNYYDVALTLSDNFGQTGIFSGTVKISISLVEGVSLSHEDIFLHVKNLDVSEWKLSKESDGVLFQTGVTNHVDVEMVSFQHVGTPLEAGVTYIIDATFVGKLADDMYGFYRSSYTDESGNVEWLATTQFQATHARRAFPCFDEPNLKAIFNIQIQYPSAYNVLGNTGIKSFQDDGTNKVTVFQQTPKMSTYLIAFIVSKFSTTSVNIDNLGNAVWSRGETMATRRYSVEMAPKILNIMRDFTSVPYEYSGLTKLDQVAIPDFAAGAMENWGLVTYRETALLWDENHSTTRNKQRVGTVVAHELAHMWFGNLVTLDWWSSAWLNEGFARYFEYHATAQVETTWELDQQFVVEQHQAILNSDSLPSSQALTSDAFTPVQISDKFGSITYSKGGSVIRMMEHFMTTDKFFNGIKDYIKSKPFSNTQPADLWESMQKQVTTVELPAQIADIMTRWTGQAGFPVVTVTSIPNSNGVSLAQKRFLFTGEDTTTKWHIPISYTNSAEKNFESTSPKGWLLSDQAALTINNALTNALWIIVNIKETGYYRVNYDDRLWDGLQNALSKTDFDGIHVLNRAQLVDDAMNLARAGIITYERALGIIGYLENEIEYYPWYAAFNALSYLRRRYDVESEVAGHINDYISDLMERLYNSVGFENYSDNQIEIHKKVLALTWACELGRPNCVQNALILFDLLKETDLEVDPDVRSVVYCTAVRQDTINWDFLWERFTTTQIASESILIITALGCTNDAPTLNNYLQSSITANSEIRRQDAQSVFSAVIGGSPAGVQIGLDFLIRHPTEISNSYGGMGALTTVIRDLADRLTTQAQLTAFENFLNNNNQEEFAEAGRTALENARANLAWATLNEEALITYFEQYFATLPPPTPPIVSSSSTTTPAPGPDPTEPDGAASTAGSVIVVIMGIVFTMLYSKR